MGSPLYSEIDSHLMKKMSDMKKSNYSTCALTVRRGGGYLGAGYRGLIRVALQDFVTGRSRTILNSQWPFDRNQNEITK